MRELQGEGSAGPRAQDQPGLLQRVPPKAQEGELLGQERGQQRQQQLGKLGGGHQAHRRPASAGAEPEQETSAAAAAAGPEEAGGAADVQGEPARLLLQQLQPAGRDRWCSHEQRPLLRRQERERRGNSFSENLEQQVLRLVPHPVCRPRPPRWWVRPSAGQARVSREPARVAL